MAGGAMPIDAPVKAGKPQQIDGGSRWARYGLRFGVLFYLSAILVAILLGLIGIFTFGAIAVRTAGG